MHDEIKRYFMDGKISEDNIVKTKSEMIHCIYNEMKDSGTVPVLDLEPQFTLSYNEETEDFSFCLSVYGVHIGTKGDLWGTAGMMNGTKIMKHTPLNKLNQY